MKSTLNVITEKMDNYPFIVYWMSVSGGEGIVHSASAMKSDFCAFETIGAADTFRDKMLKLKESKGKYRTRFVFQVSHVERTF
jgi:hypothetical protein